MLHRMNSRCEGEERYCSPPELRRRRDQPVKKPVAVLAELNESASQSVHDFKGALDVVEVDDVNLEAGVESARVSSGMLSGTR